MHELNWFDIFSIRIYSKKNSTEWFIVAMDCGYKISTEVKYETEEKLFINV